MYTTKSHTRGIGLVEAVVVVSVISAALLAVLGAASVFLRAGFLEAEKAQALYLMEESVEVMRFLRDESYSANITPLIGAGTHYLEPSGGGWTVATSGAAVLGKFTRTVTLEDVYRRNSDDDIVPLASGDPKTLDPLTTRLTATVAWGSATEVAVTYLADIYDN